MQKFMAGAVVLVAVLGASGCEKKDAEGSATPQLGAVAIIDLDVIAARLGSDKQIVDAIARRQTALSQKVAELARAYSQQITEKKQSLSAQTPPTDGVTLAAFEQAATANLEKVKLQAAQDLSSHKTQLVRQFREQIFPSPAA